MGGGERRRRKEESSTPLRGRDSSSVDSCGCTPPDRTAGRSQSPELTIPALPRASEWRHQGRRPHGPRDCNEADRHAPLAVPSLSRSHSQVDSATTVVGGLSLPSCQLCPADWATALPLDRVGRGQTSQIHWWSEASQSPQDCKYTPHPGRECSGLRRVGGAIARGDGQGDDCISASFRRTDLRRSSSLYARVGGRPGDFLAAIPDGPADCRPLRLVPAPCPPWVLPIGRLPCPDDSAIRAIRLPALHLLGSWFWAASSTPVCSLRPSKRSLSPASGERIRVPWSSSDIPLRLVHTWTIGLFRFPDEPSNGPAT